jgi:hypothetical protein
MVVKSYNLQRKKSDVKPVEKEDKVKNSVIGDLLS